MMRKFVLAAAFIAATMPASAEEGGVKEGYNLLEEGTRMLLNGLLKEIEPAMRGFTEGLDEIEPQLRDFADGMGPALGELSQLLGDLNAYHAPQRLPNGDIIIRRKVPITEPKKNAEPQVDL